MAYPKIFLKNRRDERVSEGHLWVFSNEIEKVDGSFSAGGLADLYSAKKQFLGRGFYNPRSLIAARILTRREEKIDEAFVARALQKARDLRETLFPGESSYRLVFGESDFLPGLVIDRLEDVFVIQSYCLGSDRLVPLVVQALKNNFKARAILNKSDSSIREMEGLKSETGVLHGEAEPPLEIGQGTGADRVLFKVDPLAGQKTGFFFDQRENRERIRAYCRGKTVLDCFSYTGGFGLYAAKAGAAEVTSVESSEPACRLMDMNFKLNGASNAILKEDVEEALARLGKENRKFDIIVLDPPALAKSKKNLFGALRKYKRLNELGMSLLSPEGVLFTSSCSHHAGRADFLKAVSSAASAAGKMEQILEIRGASRDHPVLGSMPETEYLKCAILRAG